MLWRKIKKDKNHAEGSEILTRCGEGFAQVAFEQRPEGGGEEGRGNSQCEGPWPEGTEVFKEQPGGQQWLEKCDRGRWQEAKSVVTETRPQMASSTLRTSVAHAG